MCVICFHKEGMSAMSLPPLEKGASVRECQQSCRRSGGRSVCLPASESDFVSSSSSSCSRLDLTFLFLESSRVEASEGAGSKKEGRKEGSSGVEGRATCKTVHVSTVCFFPFSFLFVSFPPSPLLSSPLLSFPFFLSTKVRCCRRLSAALAFHSSSPQLH